MTDSRMKMFAWWFEARLANCPDVQTFTLSAKGLNTPGIKVAELEELLQGSVITDKKESFFAQAGLTGDEIARTSVGIASDGGKISSNKDRLAQHLNQLKKTFPNKDFLQAYPFLKEYL